MAEVFPTVLRDPAEQTNTLLLGTDAPASAARLEAAARDADAGNLRKLAADRRRAARPAAARRRASTPTTARRSSG